MLQTQAIEPGTLSILRELMQFSSLKGFCLVRGTALALRYGHRLSIDLEIFNEKEFNKEHIETELIQTCGGRLMYRRSKMTWAVFCYVNNIKVDIIHYKHPIISPPELIDGIWIFHSRDLLAMKVNAILGRGRKKDFWDLFELLQHYSLSECIEAYTEKYPSQQLLISTPSALTYFVDADESEEPTSLKGQTWPGVKELIQEKVREYLI